MEVSELCGRNLVTVPAGAPVIEAARLMQEHKVGAVIVTAARADNPIAVGVLTDRDIVRAQLDRAVDMAQMRIADVMSADPLVLTEKTPVEEAIHRMRTRGVRRAPVAGPGGQLIGVISFDDLLAHVSAELAQLAHLTAPSKQPAGAACARR